MENVTPITHRVVILTKNANCRIIPGVLVLTKVDYVIFSAIGSDVQLIFPQAAIFPDVPVPFRLAAGKVSQPLSINQDLTPGSYVFAAYCSETRSFAKGGSDGEIIIQT